mgnify:CR=1 FL=1
MDLITKGRMTAKVQSKVVEFVSVVKLIERLLLFAVNPLNYYNYSPKPLIDHLQFAGQERFPF